MNFTIIFACLILVFIMLVFFKFKKDKTNEKSRLTQWENIAEHILKNCYNVATPKIYESSKSFCKINKNKESIIYLCIKRKNGKLYSNNTIFKSLLTNLGRISGDNKNVTDSTLRTFKMSNFAVLNYDFDMFKKSDKDYPTS